MSLLNELAIFSPETIGTNTSISKAWILIDTSTTVQTRIIYAFVFVHASFAIRRWNSSFSTSRNIDKIRFIKSYVCIQTCKLKIALFKFYNTYVQSYSFQRSIHSNGSGQMTLAQGLFEGQFLSKFLAMVA